MPFSRISAWLSHTHMACSLALTLFAPSCARPSQESSGAVEREIPSVFAGISLRDQDDKALGFETLRGNPVLLNFMFTSCPRICPERTRELVELQSHLPADVKARVRFLSVSVDPENDTSRALKAFAQQNGADTLRWSFASGTVDDTRALTSRLAAMDPGGPPGPAGHATTLFLFDARGRLLQRYSATPLDRQRLIRELEQVDRMNRGG